MDALHLPDNWVISHHSHSPPAIRHSSFVIRHSPLKKAAPACYSQTGAAIKQTN
jgi:hypothetical protein